MSERAATPSRPEHEAAEWFARLNRLTVTTEALHDFREWRKDPDNAAAYAAVDKTWTRARALRDDPDIRAEAEALLARRPPRPARATNPSRLWPAAALAGLALLVTAATFAFVQLRPTTYTTGHGEQRLVVLDDGSRVRLNTDTAVAVNLRRGERRLTLQRGQAFFEVARDPARPFIVTAGDTTVRALGTKFDVWRQDGGARVTLVEGRVSVARGDARPALLTPNQSIAVTRAGLTPVVAADPTQAIGWTTGRLTFRDTPLADAVAEVNRYGKATVELSPEVTAARPVSGMFDAGDTEAFVQAVSVLLDLRAEHQGDTVRLSPRPDPAG